MVEVAEQAIGAASAQTRDSARALFWRLVWLYALGSAAAVVITFLLVLLGLEFTLWQWLTFLGTVPVGIAFYTLLDVIVIRRQISPIAEALGPLDRNEQPGRDKAADALVRTLNLPFLSFLRVTLLHGPLATLALCVVMLACNELFAAEFASWQVWTFAATVMFFASPTHAIFEYFAVSREVEPAIERLTRAAGGALPDDRQGGLIAIRLKTKLLYLAIFVASLPLAFFAFSVVFKVDASRRRCHGPGRRWG